jgi:hypothetical protein
MNRASGPKSEINAHHWRSSRKPSSIVLNRCSAHVHQVPDALDDLDPRSRHAGRELARELGIVPHPGTKLGGCEQPAGGVVIVHPHDE